MRSVLRSLVSSIASLLVLAALSSPAAAMSITMSGIDSKVDVTEQVTIDVRMDTGPGLTGIILMSVGVLFSDTQLAYRPDLSVVAADLLYGGGKSSYLAPAADPPELRFGTTNQVNVDFICTDLFGGTDFTGEVLLATLIFDVIAAGDGEAEVDLSITSPGNGIFLVGGVLWTADLLGGGAVPVPEPGTALLVSAGLLGLGLTRRRRA